MTIKIHPGITNRRATKVNLRQDMLKHSESIFPSTMNIPDLVETKPKTKKNIIKLLGNYAGNFARGLESGFKALLNL